MLSHVSPGIIAMYWLLASFATATAWAVIVPRIKRVGRRTAGPRCCGMCER